MNGKTSKISRLSAFLNGAHMLGVDGLRDYHNARIALNLARCRSPFDRMVKLKKHLHPYHVVVSLTDDGAHIRIFRHDTKAELFL